MTAGHASGGEAPGGEIGRRAVHVTNTRLRTQGWGRVCVDIPMSMSGAQ